MLVVLHHACITYGAPGGWYYSQKSSLTGALVSMTLFVAVNQAFFMGFFFFLSALFIPSSYSKKGAANFIKDRLLRLGIPLIFYSFVLSPVLSYLVYRFAQGHHITYWQYLGGFDSWVDFGVLWFVAALLLFTLAYALYRGFVKNQAKTYALPSVKSILLVAAGVGVISFLVRIIFPVGWVLKPLGFQLGHFPQYIALFLFGLIASKSKWINNAEYRTGKTMAIIALCLIFIGFPLFFVARQALQFPTEWFSNGVHWQSAWYGVWEQLTGFAIITALLCIGKLRWNKPSPFLSKLSRCSFAVYIFHPLVLIALSVALSSWEMEPGLKFLIVGPLAVVGSFLLGGLIVKIPGVNRII